MRRRAFLRTSSLAWMSGFAVPVKSETNSNKLLRPALSMNAYSFNSMLMSGEMSLDELFRFAAETGFAGIDLTAYYITGYPKVPEDQVLRMSGCLTEKIHPWDIPGKRLNPGSLKHSRNVLIMLLRTE